MEGFVAELEQEVLGALLSGASFPIASSIVGRDQFLHPAHQRIFDACQTAFDRAGTCKANVTQAYIDKDALKGELTADGMRASEYLGHLVSNTAFGSARLPDSCRKVVEQWARFVAMENFEVYATAAKDPGSDIQALARRCGEMLDDVTASLRRGPNRRSRFTLAESSAGAVQSAQEARQRGSGLTGIGWGLVDVNRATGGLQKRDLTLLAARPSMGKTSIAVSAALSMVRANHGVVFISLEMDAEKLSSRILSDQASRRNRKIPYIDIIRGTLSDEQLATLTDCSTDFTGLPLYIEDQSGLMMQDIRVKLESVMALAEKQGHTIEAIMIDHIGLIKPAGRYQGNRVNEVAEISAALKGMAREYDIAVLALSQLSRGLESRDDKRPMLSDLRDSGALEQDADTVIFLYREAYYLERMKATGEKETERVQRLIDCQNKLEFIIAKQRNGPVRSIDLFADIGHCAIRDAA